MKLKIFAAFFILQMAVFLLVFEMLSFYAGISIPSFKNAEEISSRNIFRLTDNFINEKETELYKSKIGFQLLMQFNKEVSNNRCFKYYEIDSTNIYIPYISNDIFLAGYENGRPQPPAEIDDNGESVKLSCIKAFHLSPNVFGDFNINIESGRAFTRDDFLYKKGSILPVLLGYSYKELFKIGDIISTYNAYGNLKCKVVGFLKKGSNITISQEYMHFLDRYFILPSFEFTELPQTKKEKNAVIIKYLMKNSGIIKSEYDMNVISREIASIAKEIGFDNNLYIIVGQKYANDLFKLTVNEIIEVLAYFLAGMLLLLVISLNVLVKIFVERNIRFLGVHLMCGAGRVDLYKMILKKFLAMTGAALVLSLLILMLVFKIMSLEILLASAGVSSILILLTVAYSYNKNVTVDKLLRRQE